MDIKITQVEKNKKRKETIIFTADENSITIQSQKDKELYIMTIDDDILYSFYFDRYLYMLEVDNHVVTWDPDIDSEINQFCDIVYDMLRGTI